MTQDKEKEDKYDHKYRVNNFGRKRQTLENNKTHVI